jgi:hypothetical protein
MTALTNTRAKESLFGAMRRRWRVLAEHMSRSGLDSLDNEEFGRIAKDASVSVSDLRAASVPAEQLVEQPRIEALLI